MRLRAEFGRQNYVSSRSHCREMFERFSHHKHKRTRTSTLQEAGEMMKTVSGYLQGTVQSAQTLLDRNRHTNGPEGTVASKTVKSVHMIIKDWHSYKATSQRSIQNLPLLNAEALLTVKVENLHAVSHFKHPTCMQLYYARD